MGRAVHGSLVVALGMFLVSCAADTPAAVPDAGPGDGAVSSDGAGSDGARLDAGTTSDGGTMDAGVDVDAGEPLDAGDTLDAGDAVDAGDVRDAGPSDDAGAAVDGGADDAGPAPAVSCSDCHGDVDSPAPPSSLRGASSTTDRGVGAHRSHLGTSTWHNEVVCGDCHLVPAALRDVGHIDTPRPAELTWGALATTDSAAPAFDGVSCSGAYCHGATLLPGGSNTTPNWTTVDGTQADCGTCHGLPPGGAHPASGLCSTCHPTVDDTGTIIDPARHIDGIVDVIGLSCTSCHGDVAVGPAPPTDTSGGTAASLRGVGAHASHLRSSTWRHEIVCTECHAVPSVVTAAGHIDSALPAELSWGALATADTASPAFDGVSCSGAYCHGATLQPGGSNTTPSWTTVDGSQANCGTCHGLPPAGTHPTSGACSTCHPTVDAARNIIDATRHIDGVVDVVSLTCTSCHGDVAIGPAPPLDTTGGTATSRRGVGAHASHLRASTWRRAISCTECHRVPAAISAVGHIDTALPAELMWGAVATADAASPAFDGVTCTGAYCHGPTLVSGGTNTAPTWARVDGTQAACGTCHGRPPGGTHPTEANCSMCHSTVINAAGIITAPALHVDGIVQRTNYHPAGWAAPTSHGRTFNASGPSACQTCHGATLRGGTVGVSCDDCHAGWQTDCTFCHGSRPTGISSPPEGVDGQVARLDITVGAHAEHVSATSMHIAWNCTFCHGPTTPTSALSVGHIDGVPRAEVAFGPILGAGTTYAPTTGACGNTYCHGNGTRRAAAPEWDTNPTLSCGSCHAPFTGATEVQLRAMSGEHDKHVRGEGYTCSRCHGASVSAAGALLRVDLHVNGIIEVSVPSFDPAACGGRGGCTPAGCHGTECW